MSNDVTSPDYQTEYVRRMFGIADNATAATLNTWAEGEGYGPDNFSGQYVGINEADDAEPTHKATNAALKATGDGGVEQLKSLFGMAPGVSWAILDAATGVLLETNVAALQASVGSVVSFDEFLTACGLKRRVAAMPGE